MSLERIPQAALDGMREASDAIVRQNELIDEMVHRRLGLWSGKATVEGAPQAMGSKRAFTPKGWKRPIITDTGGKKLKTFQESLREAMKACKPTAPLHGPIEVRIRIFMPRPKSHFGTGKNASVLKESAPDYCTTKPDFDKVFRAVLDCGTHIWWHDDAQVCSWLPGEKRYDTEPRVEIEAFEI